VKLTKAIRLIRAIGRCIDPRAKYSLEERKAEFELSMKIYRELEHMTYGVVAIEGVRDAANARAAKLAEKDPLRKHFSNWPPIATHCDRRSWLPKKAA